MSADLQLASDRVEDVTDGLDVGDDVAEYAYELAERADLQHPINRTPDVVAASAVYFAGQLSAHPVTQEEVAEAAGVSLGAIRDGWRELAWHEDSEFVDHPPGDGPDESGEQEETQEVSPRMQQRRAVREEYEMSLIASIVIVLLISMGMVLVLGPGVILEAWEEIFRRGIRPIFGTLAIVAPVRNHTQTKTPTHANE